MHIDIGLSPQLEDYLEAISRITHDKGEAHVLEIAEQLSVHKSTVTAALRSLAEKKLINYTPYHPATLTESGRRIATEVVHRHEALSRFLSDVLLLDAETAERNACQLEHAIEKKALDRLTAYADFIEKHGGAEWVQDFISFYRD